MGGVECTMKIKALNLKHMANNSTIDKGHKVQKRSARRRLGAYRLKYCYNYNNLIYYNDHRI